MLAGLIKAPSQLNPFENLTGAAAGATSCSTPWSTTASSTRQLPQAAKRESGRARSRPTPRRGRAAGLPTGSPQEARELAGSLRGHDQASAPRSFRSCRRWPKRSSREALAGEGAAHGVSQAALVAMRRTAPCVAMVGGRDYGESQFNRAVDGAAAARLGVQALRLLRRARSRAHAGRPGRRLADRDRRLAAGEFRRRLSRRGHAAEAFARSLNTATVALAHGGRHRRGDRGRARSRHRRAAAADAEPGARLLRGQPARPHRRLCLGPRRQAPVEPWGIAAFEADEQPTRLPRRAAPSSRATDLRPYQRRLIGLLQLVVERGTGRGCRARRLRRRQDRHQPGLPRRLVHRLHRPTGRRRLGRQRRRHADGRGDRRQAAGPDLAGLHDGCIAGTA